MGAKSPCYQHRALSQGVRKEGWGQCGIQEVTPKAYCSEPLSYYYSGGCEPRT